MAVEAAESGADAAGDDLLEELPECVAGQAESPDLVGDPDAEGLAAAVACIAVAAKDTASASGFAVRAGVVKTVEKAVANEVADGIAVGTGCELELFAEGVEFVVVAV